jgi:hypothetical protein
VRREVWSAAAETAELSRLYDAGTIGAATRRRLQRNLDLETTRLTEGPHWQTNVSSGGLYFWLIFWLIG